MPFRHLIFYKMYFFKKLFQEYHQAVKQFGSRSGRTFFRPELGSNCLQSISVDDSKQSLNEFKKIFQEYQQIFKQFGSRYQARHLGANFLQQSSVDNKKVKGTGMPKTVITKNYKESFSCFNYNHMEILNIS